MSQLFSHRPTVTQESRVQCGATSTMSDIPIMLEHRMLERMREFTEKLESQNYELVSKIELDRLRADAERMRHIDATAHRVRVNGIAGYKPFCAWMWFTEDDMTIGPSVDAAIAARKGVSDVSKRSD